MNASPAYIENVRLWAGIAANVATAFGVVAALFAGFFALIRYRRDVRRSEWSDAIALYSETLREQMDDSGLRPGAWSQLSETDLNARARYMIFVNRLLWSLEGILRISHGKQGWRSSIALIAVEHSDYLRSDQFLRERHIYDAKLMEIIDNVLLSTSLDGAR